MEENNSHLLGRILAHIRQKPAPAPQAEDAVPSAETLAAPEDAPKEPVKPPKHLEIPTDSLLFSLWSSWKQASDAESGMDPASLDSESDEEAAEDLLKLTLEDGERTEIPLSDAELEKETKKAAEQLLSRAQTNFLMTRPLDSAVEDEEDGEASKDDDAQPKIPATDAEVFVYVAQKRMAAWIFAFPPSGEGRALNIKMLTDALQEAGVTSGIFKEKLLRFAREQRYFELALIAVGTPMVPPVDGWIQENFKQHPKRTFAMDFNGNINYHSQNYLQLVKKGDVICELVPPTPGKDGFDVCGTVFPAKAGKEARLSAGQNIAFSEDGTQLVALLDGHLKYEGNKFHVKTVFYVPGNVDLSVGDIDTLGDVQIQGNVLQGFSVSATGSIVIEGLVEGAEINSGADILISSGILGDHKAVIKAKGNVQAEFIENCTVYAGEQVQTNSIINSRVYSDNEILVQAGRGTIIGGRLIAANRIAAKVIGCESEKITVLSVGQLPYVQMKKEELQKSLAKLQNEAESLERISQSLAASEDPAAISRSGEFRLKQSVVAMQISHQQKSLEALADEETIDISKCRIKADTIYPVTHVSIGSSQLTITERTMSCSIHSAQGEILLL